MGNKITPAGNVSFVPQTARADIASMGGGGKGLIQAGQDIIGYGDLMTVRSERKADLAQQEMMSSDRLKWSTRLANLEKEGGLDASETLKREMDKDIPLQQDKLETGKARDNYKINMASLRSTLMISAIKIQGKAQAKQEITVLRTTLDKNLNAVRANPSLLENVLKDNSKLINETKFQNEQQKLEVLTVENFKVYDNIFLLIV